jgi:hypothetical protein
MQKFQRKTQTACAIFHGRFHTQHRKGPASSFNNVFFANLTGLFDYISEL